MVGLFQGLNAKEVKRPVGELDVFIGFEYAGFHPIRGQYSDHVPVLKNQFGRCLGGSDPLLSEKTRKLLQHVAIHHLDCAKVGDFFDNETLGVECHPRCGGCKCRKCPVGSKSFTLKEERELRLISEGLTHKEYHWETKYPWVKVLAEPPDNFQAAIGMLQNTEKRLLRSKTHADMYKDQIQNLIYRGVNHKLSESEIREYDGPIHYISHHEVLKPDSSPTPCRIVLISSAKFHGHSLNNYWAKGPDLLNNLLDVLLCLKEGQVAITGDIKRMYHAGKIPLLDQHTHRFLWQNFDTSHDPDIFVITSVSFGDKPAGNIAITALQKTAEMGENRYPDAASVILKNTYVDDIVDSVNSHKEVVELTKQIDELMESGGFKVKVWSLSNTSINEEVKPPNIPHESNKQSEQPAVGGVQYHLMRYLNMDHSNLSHTLIHRKFWDHTGTRPLTCLTLVFA